MNCINCGKEIAEGTQTCQDCDKLSEQPQVSAVHKKGKQPRIKKQSTEESQLSMKWYKFLIYFGLLLYAVGNAIDAANLITGNIYNVGGITDDMVYSTFPPLKGVDIVHGIILIATAVLAIIIRQQLVRFKTTGVKLLYTISIIDMVLPILYMIASSIVIAELALDRDLFIQVFRGIFLYIVNRQYFGKRMHLFS